MRISIYLLKNILATISVLFIMASSLDAFADEPQDFSRLVKFIELKDKVEPLFPFSDYKPDSDESNHKDYLEYINN